MQPAPAEGDPPYTEATRCSGRRVAFWLISLGADGVITSTLRLAQELARQGVHVDLIVSQNAGALRASVGDFARIIDLGLGRSSYAQGLLSVWRYVLRERPDAVCAPDGAGYLLAAAARTARAKTSIWVWVRLTAQDACMARASRPRGRMVKRLRRQGARSFYALCTGLGNSADGVIANSGAVAEQLRLRKRIEGSRIHVIHNPAINDDILNIIDNLGQSRSMTEDRSVIISIGRLHPQKNFDLLLRAFQIVRSQRLARLVILGEGRERAALERLVSDLGLLDDVTIPGFVANPFAQLACADLFVLPSRYEPFGNALVEAMACGCPVVSTDCTGPREILEGGRYGRLVPVGNHEALADSMLATLDDPPDPSILRARAQDFHVDRIAGEYRRLLEV